MREKPKTGRLNGAFALMLLRWGGGIAGALYFALRPKKWETAAEDFDTEHDDYAEATDD